MRTGLAEPSGLLPLPGMTHGKVRSRAMDSSFKASDLASTDTGASRANA